MDSINITGAKILYTIPVLGGINITETQVNSWLVLLFVFILCKVLTHNMKVKAETKRQMLAELIVEKATNLVRENMGEKFLNFAPFIASIIALSALMTTTMQRIREVVIYAHEQKVSAKIMIGGAVITQEYADEIGADGYSRDAAEAVKVAKQLTASPVKQ